MNHIVSPCRDCHSSSYEIALTAVLSVLSKSKNYLSSNPTWQHRYRCKRRQNIRVRYHGGGRGAGGGGGRGARVLDAAQVDGAVHHQRLPRARVQLRAQRVVLVPARLDERSCNPSAIVSCHRIFVIGHVYTYTARKARGSPRSAPAAKEKRSVVQRSSERAARRRRRLGTGAGPRRHCTLTCSLNTPTVNHAPWCSAWNSVPPVLLLRAHTPRTLASRGACSVRYPKKYVVGRPGHVLSETTPYIQYKNAELF